MMFVSFTYHIFHIKGGKSILYQELSDIQKALDNSNEKRSMLVTVFKIKYALEIYTDILLLRKLLLLLEMLLIDNGLVFDY